jgi:hypothetical protein
MCSYLTETFKNKVREQGAKKGIVWASGIKLASLQPGIERQSGNYVLCTAVCGYYLSIALFIE